MKIAIDIDGVLLDIMVTYCEIFNAKHNTEYTKEDVTSWEFFKSWDIPEKDAFEIFYNLYTDSMKVPIIDKEATEIMHRLNNCHDVYIVTARSPEYRAPIIKKFRFHNIFKGIHYEDLILLHQKPYDIKLSLDFDVYVDDNPNLVESIKDMADKKLLLYDQPWNQDLILYRNIKRVFNWKDIEREIGC